MSHTASALAAAVLVSLALAGPSAGAAGEAPADLPRIAAGPAMQQDLSHPAWSTLQGLGLGPADWAVLLAEDTDGNGRTGFLDLLATLGIDPVVEVLVHGDVPARQALLAAWPEATEILAAQAVFLTVQVSGLDALEVPGVTLVAWEPRAHAAASTNPAGGAPATMAQNSISQVGAAWSSGYQGAGVRIAVLDTGADIAHQSLDAGKVTRFKDCIGAGTASYDDHGHGTHVASIAAGDDGPDFKGVAPLANLTVVKVLDAAGSGSIAQFQCGVDYVYKGGPGATRTAEVASMSAGLAVPPLGVTTLNGGDLDVFGWDRVATQIPAHGIPFAVAAGNHLGTVVEVGGVDETLHAGVNGVNQVSSPGYAPAVLTVGAVDAGQAPATFTGIGPGKLGAFKPDVAAHGVSTWGALRGSPAFYEQWSGTSMATPVAGGVLALAVDKNGALGVTMYYSAVKDGAQSACVLSAGPSCYLGLAREPVRPNFTDGYGVVKASATLALIP